MSAVADCQLTIRAAEGAYVADLELTDTAGQAATQLALSQPIALDLAALLAQAHEPDAYGALLTQQLFAAPQLRAGWGRARAYAHGAQAALRLRLRLPPAPDLDAVRWELLRDPEGSAPIAPSEQVRLVRYLDSPDLTPVVVPPRPQLSAVVAIAAPSGLARLNLAEVDVDGEAARARRSLGTVPAALVGQMEGTAAPRATLRAILNALRDGAPILYLVCHGLLIDGESHLILEADDGTDQRVAGSAVASAIAGLSRRPLLAILVACNGGAGLSALGPLLAQAGIAAVVAMQAPITMAAARQFLPDLLRELARDGQIDRAVAAARAALAQGAEWWVPALWLRARDGRLWHEPPPAQQAHGTGVTMDIEVQDGKVGEIVGIDRQGASTAPADPVRHKILISGGETGSIIGSRIGGGAAAPHVGKQAAIDQHRQRLDAHRATLATYLNQQAIAGSANVRPEVTHGIREARAGIAKAKAALRALGVEPDAHADDEPDPAPPPPAPHAPDPQSAAAQPAPARPELDPPGAAPRLIYLGGIDAETGAYSVPALSLADVGRLGRDLPIDGALAKWFQQRLAAQEQGHFGPDASLDRTNLAQVGWALVLAEGEDPAVEAALAPLIALRRRQSAHVHILRYRHGERYNTWLARNGVAAGTVDPKLVPYYLLIVGDPATIPLSFSNPLKIDFAVGLLHLPTPDAYRAYAQSVADYEEAAAPPTAREAVFFAPEHPQDPATQIGQSSLIAPLLGIPARGVQEGQRSVAARMGYAERHLLRTDATKSALTAAIAPPPGARPPTLLFAMGHGVVLPAGHPLQRAEQGALICQDWPGLNRPVLPDHRFAGADLAAIDARIHGMICVHFHCFSAATPDLEGYLAQGADRPRLAPQPFMAALPQALLSRPGGAALACIGHVDRGWDLAITTAGVGSQPLPFDNAVQRILRGDPVGLALEDVVKRYATIAVGLQTLKDDIRFGATPSDEEVAREWLARNDAEGYVLLGDPAARVHPQLRTIKEEPHAP